MKKRVAVLTLIVGLGTVAYQGCGGVHENAGVDYSSEIASYAAEDQAGFAAFVNGFYGFAKSQNCVMCHGAFQTPKFADPDPKVAYSFFKTLVNPADPASSIIITYAGNGHCSAAPCSDVNVRPQVTSLLQSWAAAEIGGNGGETQTAKYLTDSKPLPATLPKLGAAPALLRYPLAGFNIPALSKAVLELEVNLYSPGEYRVARAKIGGATATVTLTGLHVYVRSSTATKGIGIEDPNQGMAWAGVVAVVNATTLPTNLPTTALNVPVMVSNALAISAQSTSDVLTVGIDDIQVGAVATPSVVRFADLISGNQTLGVFAQSCVSCHSGGAPSAGLDLSNYTQAKNKAAQIQVRMNSAASPMPPSGLLGAGPRQVVNTWVTGGAIQ